MYARSNGLFPTQDKIVAKIKKAWKNLGPKGFVRLKIPWSDFEFSSVEPWPKSFREGLQAYQDYLATDFEPPEDDVPRYKITPYRALDWWRASSRWKNKAFSEFRVSKQDFSPKDLWEETEQHPGVLGRMLWDNSAKQIKYSGDLPFLRPLLPRKADETGVWVELQKEGTKGELRKEKGVLGLFHDRLDGYVLIIRFERWGTIAHEIMHFAQEVGDQLLLARSTPDISFLTYYLSDVELTGLGARPKNDFQRVLALDETAYEEQPIEFYPRAYSAAYTALKMTSTWPLLKRVLAASINTAFEMLSDKQRFLFIKAAYQYAKQLQGESSTLSATDSEQIKSYAAAVDLTQMAEILAYRLVFAKKTQPARWESGSTYLGYILHIVFCHHKLEARFVAGKGIEATEYAFTRLPTIIEDVIRLTDTMFDDYDRLTGTKINRDDMFGHIHEVLIAHYGTDFTT